MAGIFTGLGKARASMDGNYVRPCQTVFLVRRCGEGKNFSEEPFFIIELTAVLDLAPTMFTKGTPGVEHSAYGHSPGEECAQIIMKKHPSFLGNVKTAIAALANCEVSEVDEEVAAQVVGDSQPLAGVLVQVEARHQATRKGGVYTKVNWKGVVDPRTVRNELQKLGAEGESLINRLFPGGRLDQLCLDAEKA